MLPGVVAWYLASIVVQPVLTNGVAATAIFTVTDLSSQEYRHLWFGFPVNREKSIHSAADGVNASACARSFLLPTTGRTRRRCGLCLVYGKAAVWSRVPPR